MTKRELIYAISERLISDAFELQAHLNNYNTNKISKHKLHEMRALAYSMYDHVLELRMSSYRKSEGTMKELAD